MKTRKLAKRLKFHFETPHLLVIFGLIILFQLITSVTHKISLQDFLFRTQYLYQQDSVERVANLSSTSLELFIESYLKTQDNSQDFQNKIIQVFNILLSQQILQQQIESVCLLIEQDGTVYAIDDGDQLYHLVFRIPPMSTLPQPQYEHATKLYKDIKSRLVETERIQSILQGDNTFHVFVPFAPKGEFMGAFYMKNSPDVNFITAAINSTFNKSSVIFISLILFGMVAMLYMSSNTIKERDHAQKLLYKEREKQLREEIHHQKERLFTKRIYHTHHKAEKIAGFIKEDLRKLAASNISEIKFRVTKYANFISRVIYDMKWYDPPIQTIRNPIFRTDINSIIRFLVREIFQRVAQHKDMYTFRLDLDENLPPVNINEYVVWEIIEPLIQNSIEHSEVENLIITIRTRHMANKKESKIIIQDNGRGIHEELLTENKHGIQKIFQEQVSTKMTDHHSGYGSFIAYELSTNRCGWSIHTQNRPQGGAEVIITIPNHQ